VKCVGWFKSSNLGYDFTFQHSVFKRGMATVVGGHSSRALRSRSYRHFPPLSSDLGETGEEAFINGNLLKCFTLSGFGISVVRKMAVCWSVVLIRKYVFDIHVTVHPDIFL
jgi:hypothetical protein